VISPILRGMLGLDVDAEKHQLTLAPDVPSNGTSFSLCNVYIGSITLDLDYHKSAESIAIEATSSGAGECWVEFSPAVSPRAQIVSAELNGRPIAFKLTRNDHDQHVSVRLPVYGGRNRLVIRVKNDFGLTLENPLPPLGSASRGLRVISDSWNASNDQLTLELSGRGGEHYELAVSNPGQVAKIEGATIAKSGRLEIQMPGPPSESYVSQKVVLVFGH